MEDRSDRMRRYYDACHEAGSKVSAAEMMTEAALKELDAALTIGDWELVEKARETCIARYEAFLDIKVCELRKLKDMGNPYT